MHAINTVWTNAGIVIPLSVDHSVQEQLRRRLGANTHEEPTTAKFELRGE
jgi:hypothetical protein